MRTLVWVRKAAPGAAEDVAAQAVTGPKGRGLEPEQSLLLRQMMAIEDRLALP